MGAFCSCYRGHVVVKSVTGVMLLVIKWEHSVPGFNVVVKLTVLFQGS